MRFNSDGTPDGSFMAGRAEAGSVSSLVLQKDGKILIGGDFQYFSGTTNSYLVRLNPDGSPDHTFQFRSSYNTPRPIGALAIQSDGSILFGERSTLYVRADVVLGRLTTNGTFDTSFQTLMVYWADGASPPNHTTDYILVLENDEILASVETGFLKFHSNGTLDRRFTRPASQGSFRVNCIAVNKHGQIIVGGLFTNLNNILVNNLARLSPDGALDPNFVPAVNFYPGGRLSQLHVTPDNKLFISGGIFASARTNQQGLVKLNHDGSLDTTFDSSGTRVGGPFAVQTDNKVVVGGFFTNTAGASWYRLVRLTNEPPAPPLILEEPASQITFAGERIRIHVTTTCAGEAPTYTWHRNGLVLPGEASDILFITNCAPTDAGFYHVVVSNSVGTVTSAVANVTVQIPMQAGSVDPNFYAGRGPNNTVYAMARDTNGSVMIGGAFTSVDGLPRTRIARLNSSGALDPTFNPGSGADQEIRALAIQDDGRTIAGGFFSNFNGVATGPVVRLNPDGTLDNSFLVQGFRSGHVHTLMLTEDGKILLGGNFEMQDFLIRKVVRLNQNGSLDTSFACNLPSARFLTAEPVYSLARLPEGSILAAGDFPNSVAKLKANGTVETTFISPSNNIIYTVITDGRDSFFAGVRSSNFSLTVTKYGAFGDANPDFKGLISRTNSSAVTIRALALDDCSRVLVGGTFDTVNSGNQSCLARLDNTGATDLTFKQGLRIDGRVYCILPLADGTTLVGGDFVNVGEAYRPRIARLIADPPFPPLLSKQLSNQTASGGASVIFDPGSSYCSQNTYQWFQNGKPLAGATNSTLSYPSASPTNSGDFFVVAGNRYGMVTSSVGALIVAKETILPGSLNIDFYPQLPSTSWKVTAFAPAGEESVILGLQNTYPSLNSLIKLNSAGTQDTRFTSPNFPSRIQALAVETNGAVWVVQEYQQFLTRLLANGNRDTNFVSSIVGFISSLTMQADGKLLVAGSLNPPTNGLTRLLPSGLRDTNFTPGPITGVSHLALQKDGKIIIGGSFASVGNLSRRGIARLKENGTLDPSFQMPLGTNEFSITALAVGANDGIFVSGFFSISNETRRGQLVRLRTDGSVDPAFNSQPGSSLIRSIAVSAGEKVAVAGNLTSFGGMPARWIARLNSDGSLDSAFDIGMGPETNVANVAIHPDGRIFAGGNFTKFNGLPRPGFVVLNGDPTLWKLSKSEASFQFSLPLFSGWNPVIEEKEEIGGTDWAPLSIQPVGQRVVVPTPSLGQRIYRVRYE